MRPLAHRIPARRDAKGNSLPRSFTHARPGICADSEAAIEAAAYDIDEIESAGRAYPLLKVKQAVRVAGNAVAVAAQLHEDLDSRNAALRNQIAEIEQRLEPLQKVANELEAEAEKACAAAGCKLPEGSEIRPVPISLSPEFIAANRSFVLTKPSNTVGLFLLNLAATLGCGTMFGISCGLLSGSLYLEDLASSRAPLVLWSILGTAIVSLIGSTLAQLAGHIGERTEWKAITSGDPGKRPLWPLLIGTMLLAAVFTAIESQVEKLGILRSLREGLSLESFAISDGELAIVSLLLALPVVCWYLVDGYSHAVRRVRDTYVAGEIAQHEREILCAGLFHRAVRACVEAKNARTPVEILNAEAATTKAKIRDNLTQTELEQIEDCEFDALVADWAAEDALLAQIALDALQKRPERAPRGFLARAASYFGKLLARQA